MRASHALQDRAGGADVERHRLARHVRVLVQSGSLGGKHLALVVELLPVQERANNLNTLSHNRGRTDALAFLAFAGVLHEDFRRTQSQQKASLSRGFLHHARLHRDLDRVAGVGRDNSPSHSDLLGFARDNGRDGGAGAGFHGMFSPPRIGLCQPEGIKPRLVASLGHPNRLVQRLHAEL